MLIRCHPANPAVTNDRWMVSETHRERTLALPELIDRIVGSDGVLDALRELGPLAAVAQSVPPAAAVDALTPLVERHGSDSLAAYLATYALGGVESPEADAVLIDALCRRDTGLAEHAAWALSRRHPRPSAVPYLAELAEHGGFTQMMAELALESWLREMPGLMWSVGRQLSSQMQASAGAQPTSSPRRRTTDGIRIAQVLMHGRVDAELSAPGSGDGGGLVTLQVGLTRELAAHEAVSEVFLITRKVDDRSGRFVDTSEQISDGGTLTRLGFGPSGYVPIADMWPHRLELEHELRRFLIENGPFDAMHLRFADVGSFAAARVGEELGIPMFFTLAPDPHSVLARSEASGALTRASFAEADLEHHYLFRAWLVGWMLDRSEKLALLPRNGQAEEFRDLLGVDIEGAPGRFRTVAEGVDYARALEARNTLENLALDRDPPPVLLDLERAIAGLPHRRRGLPMILTVGRLNPVKGMSRIVEAWTTDEWIRSRYNLVIVGGDISSPTSSEMEVLDAICSAAGMGSSEGLLLLGGRSHGEVSLLMAAAAEGMQGSIGSDGIYVSGSEKEEFGLAIVEALASGLPVVAPETGGPATYVEHEFTGFLTDTTVPSNIQRGIRWADTARRSQVRADAGRRLVKNQYSLSAMAEGLVDMYLSGGERHSTAS